MKPEEKQELLALKFIHCPNGYNVILPLAGDSKKGIHVANILKSKHKDGEEYYRPVSPHPYTDWLEGNKTTFTGKKWKDDCTAFLSSTLIKTFRKNLRTE